MIEGRGHNVPATGAPYNDRLERFLAASARDLSVAAKRETVGRW